MTTLSFPDLTDFIKKGLMTTPLICAGSSSPTKTCYLIDPNTNDFYIDNEAGCGQAPQFSGYSCGVLSAKPGPVGMTAEEWLSKKYASILKSYLPKTIVFQGLDAVNADNVPFYIDNTAYTLFLPQPILSYFSDVLRANSTSSTVNVPEVTKSVSAPITTIANFFSTISSATKSSNKTQEDKKKRKLYIIIGIAVAVGVVILLGILFVLIYFGSKKTTSYPYPYSSTSYPYSYQPRMPYSYY